MNKETEQLLIEMRKEIELIDKAIEQADKTYTMTTDEKALVLGKLYEGVYPKSTLWKAYRNLNEIKKSLESACQLIIEVSQRHEDSLISKILHGSKALCEENPDLIKGIIDTPKTSEEKIAEDFVENYLPENFVEDFLNK